MTTNDGINMVISANEVATEFGVVYYRIPGTVV